MVDLILVLAMIRKSESVRASNLNDAREWLASFYSFIRLATFLNDRALSDEQRKNPARYTLSGPFKDLDSLSLTDWQGGITLRANQRTI